MCSKRDIVRLNRFAKISPLRVLTSRNGWHFVAVPKTVKELENCISLGAVTVYTKVR